MFTEKIAVDYENREQYSSTLCGRKAGLLSVTSGGAHSYH